MVSFVFAECIHLCEAQLFKHSYGIVTTYLYVKIPQHIFYFCHHMPRLKRAPMSSFRSNFSVILHRDCGVFQQMKPFLYSICVLLLLIKQEIYKKVNYLFIVCIVGILVTENDLIHLLHTITFRIC